jgi:hypothetical protein
MVPGLEPYFISSHHDDVTSVLAHYGPSAGGGLLRGIIHGYTTTPGMIGVICAAVGGVLAAIVAMLSTHAPATAGLVGLAGFLLVNAVLNVLVVLQVLGAMRGIKAAFPSDEARSR